MLMLVLLKILSSASRIPRQISDPAGDCRVNPCVEEEGVCGQGAECEDVGPCPECQCLPGHHGDPYDGGCIAGECGQNSDCGPQRACKDYKCVDPCALSCGQGADCTVQNHVAICRCPKGTTGDPFRNCRRFTRAEICAPCGQNTDCEVRRAEIFLGKL